MGSLNRLLCIGIGVIWMANLMHMSGMATPHWVNHKTFYVIDKDNAKILVPSDEEDSFAGLFEECKPNEPLDPDCSDLRFDRIPMKEQVLQVLAYLTLCCGMLGIGAAIVLQLIVYLSHTDVARWVLILTTSIAATSCMASFGFIISTLGLFGDRLMKIGSTLDYSFFLCLFASFLYLAGASLITYASKNIPIRKGQGQQEGRGENGVGGNRPPQSNPDDENLVIETDDGQRRFLAVN